ncbi:hypothetical protein CO2235_MP20295 [Cupriavidus oxalaticus]|uniref:Uncharacterized protein n=1 Tax=Cupriavidus oxalaticus TaxID=96344 RepID=A0A976GCZ0_9BURK|nr:hypothetical protein CO2235_MP20295 [Cupriavidus oxalaticus]
MQGFMAARDRLWQIVGEQTGCRGQG